MATAMPLKMTARPACSIVSIDRLAAVAAGSAPPRASA